MPVPGAGCWVLAGWCLVGLASWEERVEVGSGPLHARLSANYGPGSPPVVILGHWFPSRASGSQFNQRGPTLFRWCRGSGCCRARCVRTVHIGHDIYHTSLIRLTNRRCSLYELGGLSFCFCLSIAPCRLPTTLDQLHLLKCHSPVPFPTLWCCCCQIVAFVSAAACRLVPPAHNGRQAA